MILLRALWLALRFDPYSGCLSWPSRWPDSFSPARSFNAETNHDPCCDGCVVCEDKADGGAR